MFGQSISGDVDMDGNGYTGMKRIKVRKKKFPKHIRKITPKDQIGGNESDKYLVFQPDVSDSLLLRAKTRDRGILFTAFLS